MRLTWWEKRWLEAIFEGFAPPRADAAEGLLTPEPGEVDHVGRFAEMNEHASPIAKLGMHVAVHLVGLAPVWTGTKLAGFDRLDEEARVALLEELMEHPFALVKELSWLMKVQAAMTLFGTPSIRARSGYDRGREEKMPVRLRVKKDGSMKVVA